MSSAGQVIFINDSYFSNISLCLPLVRLYLLMIAILVIFPYVFARQVIFINASYFSNISLCLPLVRLYLLLIAILVIFPYVFRSSGYIY